MLENINTSPNSRDDGAGTPENYLSRAVAACEAGDARLGLHLYLAAFEQAAEQSDAPSEDAIMGLKQAWRPSLCIRTESGTSGFRRGYCPVCCHKRQEWFL